ncbi:unnamed protein product [Rotaria magnacalcarata]|uniref:Endonuclease/exonuclease/phosphatase domain-containing protein n=1 Tax=Rotaria magnacalcarata TaxID=392030 RepID=A0A817A0Y9_9BILA|nr:unnamed protein product [Rotaria magnacalcarata]
MHLLCFNVRGLDLRWGEVCLLVKRHRFYIIVLGEVGHVDFSLLGAAFANYPIFYQAGENPHGGVLNVCVVDLLLEQTIRLIAIYAPVSKSWDWMDLSSFVTNRCTITGDFNIDIEKDGEKAERLLEWMDSCCLGPFIPVTSTAKED